MKPRTKLILTRIACDSAFIVITLGAVCLVVQLGFWMGTEPHLHALIVLYSLVRISLVVEAYFSSMIKSRKIIDKKNKL